MIEIDFRKEHRKTIEIRYNDSNGNKYPWETIKKDNINKILKTSFIEIP